MTETLFTIHSFVRYLVLIAALGAIVTAALGWKSSKPTGAERPLASAFVGLLDLQVLLGVLLILFGFQFYGQLIGHIFMMVLAAATAHAAVVVARSREPRSASGTRLLGFVLALVFIVGGIMAIQRSIL